MSWVLVERMQFSCKALNHYLIVKEVGNNLVKKKLAQYPLLLLFESNMAKGPSKFHVGQIAHQFLFLYDKDKSQFIENIRNPDLTSIYLPSLLLFL